MNAADGSKALPVGSWMISQTPLQAERGLQI